MTTVSATFDALQREAVEVAVCLLEAGLRPLPLDLVTGRPLIPPDRYPVNGDADENWVRGVWFDWPRATVGILRIDGAVVACSAEALAAANAAAARRNLDKTARFFTDLGNSCRLVQRHGLNLRYVPAWGRWLLWDGSRWRPDDGLEIMQVCKSVALMLFEEVRDAEAAASRLPEKSDERRAAEKSARAIQAWAFASQRRERLMAMEALGRSAAVARPEGLDADGWVLNVGNGTLDLRTGTLRPHQREDLLTRLAPVTFDANAQCPRWTRFLEEIMGGNEVLIAYLQRVAGMCLTADVSEQCLFIFHGRGANGKSTFLDTLTGLMGDYAAEAAPDLLVVRRNQEHPTEIADLCGRRLVVAAETEEGGALRVNLLKRLTGNARLKARFMREDFFEFARTHKLILATNSKPAVREGTHAAWRRIRLVPFDVTIPEAHQDKGLLARLRAEWPGILAWAVQGCLDWQRQGLQTPEEVENATQTYEDEQDVLAEFIEECLILAPGAAALRTAVWSEYSAWVARRRERHPLGRTSLYDRLRRRSGVAEDDRRAGGRTVRFFTGLRLTAGREGEEEPRGGGPDGLPFP